MEAVEEADMAVGIKWTRSVHCEGENCHGGGQTGQEVKGEEASEEEVSRGECHSEASLEGTTRSGQHALWGRHIWTWGERKEGE